MGVPTLYRGAMAKRGYSLLVKEVEGRKRLNTKSWAFVVLLGVLLTVVALLDRGSLETTRADGSTGCQLEVTTDQLNIRVGPAVDAESDGTVTRGQLLDGTTTVVDGFRELEDGRYVADEFLTPVPGTDCR